MLKRLEEIAKEWGLPTATSGLIAWLWASGWAQWIPAVLVACLGIYTLILDRRLPWQRSVYKDLEELNKAGEGTHRKLLLKLSKAVDAAAWGQVLQLPGGTLAKPRNAGPWLRSMVYAQHRLNEWFGLPIWSFQGFGRLLVLAVLYPVLGLLATWLVNDVGKIGGTVVLPPVGATWEGFVIRAAVCLIALWPVLAWFAFKTKVRHWLADRSSPAQVFAAIRAMPLPIQPLAAVAAVVVLVTVVMLVAVVRTGAGPASEPLIVVFAVAALVAAVGVIAVAVALVIAGASVGAFIVAFAVIVTGTFAFAFAIAVGAVFAIAVAAFVAGLGAAGGSGAGAGVVADAFSIALNGVGVVALAVGFAVIFAVVVAVPLHRERRTKTLFHDGADIGSVTFLGAAWILTALATTTCPLWWPGFKSDMLREVFAFEAVLVFAFIWMSVVNALFDWVSLGITRSLLCRMVLNPAWNWLGMVLDVLFGLVLTALLFALAFAVLGFMQWCDWPVDVEASFRAFQANPLDPDVAWIALLAITNMLPTLWHVVVGLWGLVDRQFSVTPHLRDSLTSLHGVMDADGTIKLGATPPNLGTLDLQAVFNSLFVYPWLYALSVVALVSGLWGSYVQALRWIAGLLLGTIST